MIWAQIVDGFTKEPQPIVERQLPPTHKHCKGCGEDKPVEEFYARNEGNKRASRCKPCYIKYQKKLRGEK